jgi:hypothetical protein
VGVFRREQVTSRRKQLTDFAVPRVGSTPLPPGYTFAQTAPYSTPRSLTAAAAQVRLNDKGEAEYFKTRRHAYSSAWQSEAWEYYDAIGEVKYAFNLVASVVSRIRLYAAVIDNPAETPTSVRDSFRCPSARVQEFPSPGTFAPSTKFRLTRKTTTASLLAVIFLLEATLRADLLRELSHCLVRRLSAASGERTHASPKKPIRHYAACLIFAPSFFC